MAELAATRDAGWSWSAGYHQDQQSFVARAWKPRPKPVRSPMGVVLYLHTVSAASDSIDDAARRCARLARERDAGDARPSAAEREYVEHVAAWRPSR